MGFCCWRRKKIFRCLKAQSTGTAFVFVPLYFRQDRTLLEGSNGSGHVFVYDTNEQQIRLQCLPVADPKNIRFGGSTAGSGFSKKSSLQSTPSRKKKILAYGSVQDVTSPEHRQRTIQVV